MTRGNRERLYEVGVCDLAALVALDIRRIAYLPIHEAASSVVVRSHDDPSPPAHGGKRGRTFDELTIARALRELGR